MILNNLIEIPKQNSNIISKIDDTWNRSVSIINSRLLELKDNANKMLINMDKIKEFQSREFELSKHLTDIINIYEELGN